MYTTMNKGKIFVISLITIITVSFVSVVGISIYLILNSSFNFNNPILETPIPVSQEETNLETFLVVDVVDGDTIKVIENNQTKTIRLIGIDAPESRSNDCKNEEATQLLSNLILNKQVTLESDSTQADLDRFGRQLRYVFLDEVNVNREIIKAGFAMEYTYSKPYKYKDIFTQSQNSAQIQELGIWSGECLLK